MSNSHTILSYKQFREINVDTNVDDLKLGKGNFSIYIDIMPYVNAFKTREWVFGNY
jgi:hypothetical protein